jgi:hypothetical protein
MEYKEDALISKVNPGLEDVYKIYEKWIHIEDLNRIDVVLAVRLISKISSTRVWMIIVGASGDWKSEQLRALSRSSDVKIIRNMTSKTLVNGNPHTPDLAPTLQDKTMVIQDFAQILKLHPSEKAEVWAQLRDLYDGFAGKQSGLGKDVEYNNLNVTLLAASTPVIDGQILIHQDLGTRELIWRCKKVEKPKNLMHAVKNNLKIEDAMRYELSEVTNNFLDSHTFNKDLEIPEEISDKLAKKALKLSYLRASAETDSYTGELRSDVTPEMPTRVYKQFLLLYQALKSLDEDYSDERAMKVIDHIVEGSSFNIRTKVLNLFCKNPDMVYNISQVADDLKIGKKTAFKELGVLWNLGILYKRTISENNGYERAEWRIYNKPLPWEVQDEEKT